MSLLIIFTLGTIASYRHKQHSLTGCNALSKQRQPLSQSPEGLREGGGTEGKWKRERERG